MFQLFSEVFAEDALFLCEIAERMATEDEDPEKGRMQQKQKNKGMMTRMARVMEVRFYLCYV